MHHTYFYCINYVKRLELARVSTDFRENKSQPLKQTRKQNITDNMKMEYFFVKKKLISKSMQFDVKAKPPSNKIVLYNIELL